MKVKRLANLTETLIQESIAICGILFKEISALKVLGVISNGNKVFQQYLEENTEVTAV